jgi:hypothetical protein
MGETMMLTKNMAHAWVLGVILLVLGTTAEAQLAPEGSFGGTFGWYSLIEDATSNAAQAPVMEKFGGTFFHDHEKGFLHNAAVTCQGLSHGTETLKSHGDCIVTDRDGDTARLLWQCEGKAVCEGQGYWTQGEGKYKGITGNMVFSRYALTPTAAGYSLWRGTWQLPVDRASQAHATDGPRTASAPEANHTR